MVLAESKLAIAGLVFLLSADCNLEFFRLLLLSLRCRPSYRKFYRFNRCRV